MPETALVGDIVDRKQRGHVFELRHAALFDLQVRRDEPRLPIVGVDHVELQAQLARRFDHGPGEKHEPLAIVAVIAAFLAIQLRPVVVVVLLDEIDRHLAVGQVALEQRSGDRPRADRQVQSNRQPLDRQPRRMDLPVGRHDHQRLVPEPGQLDRQGTADIGQSAGLGERDRFAGGNQDLHAVWQLRSYISCSGRLRFFRSPHQPEESSGAGWVRPPVPAVASAQARQAGRGNALPTAGTPPARRLHAAPSASLISASPVATKLAEKAQRMKLQKELCNSLAARRQRFRAGSKQELPAENKRCR